MTIRTGELPPIPNPSLEDNAPRYYWRSVTYDLYVGAGWYTSSAPQQSYQANTPLIPGLLNGYRLLHLDVEMVEPEGKLFWSGILFSVDVPLTANWRLRPQSSLFAEQTALLQADMFAAPSTATAYKAQSYIPTATIAELRLASTEYPEQISDRYLDLPSSVPERVYQLASEITAGRDNPYDKAKAIEAYLRTYPYDLEVPAPPEDQDVADYFLFDLKKGYCDYYATAMVVLARASGVPARFVSGYASGSYDAPNAQYIVRELHAHSWAEVFFPGIGWIEFEPTASQPEIERIESNVVTPVSETPDPAGMELLNRFRLMRASIWLTPLAGLLLLFFVYFTLIERWLYLRLAPAIAIERIYRRLYRHGRTLAGERARAETAYEFEKLLIAKIEAIKARSRARLARIFSRAQQDIELLTELYQSSLFTETHTEKNHARLALNTWKHLRLRLIMATVIARRSR